MPAHYDTIGKTYTSTRAADPRISGRLGSLLGLAEGANLVDIGAGSGNYSYALAKLGYQVQAVEPSAIMRAQAKSHPRLQWCAAGAEALPFNDAEFDGAVMTLCLHHFRSWQTGIEEALRVSGGGPLVVFAFDIEHKADFWLFDYFPHFVDIDLTSSQTINEIELFVTNQLKTDFYREPFALPKDLIDHFAAADWARPHNYLDKTYRDGISTFHKLQDADLKNRLEVLREDLDNGGWQEKYGALLDNATYDRGYLFMRIG